MKQQEQNSLEHINEGPQIIKDESDRKILKIRTTLDVSF